MKFTFLSLTFGAVFIFFTSSCRVITGAKGYEGPTSDHFDGETFKNSVVSHGGFLNFLKMRLGTDYADWPENIPVERQKVSASNSQITFIGHSTFLIQEADLNILTDPIFSERASPFSFAGPKRVREPAVSFDDLPRVDVILISHNHYDHLDLEFLKKISSRDNPQIVVGLGVDLLLRDHGILNVVALDWGQVHSISGVDFHFLECQHFSSRGLLDRNQTLWGSFAILFGKKSVYFAGDTGYGPHFKNQGIKFGSFDLAIIPIGAYEPRWFMKHMHLNPEEAVLAHIDLNAKKSIGAHFGTFQLTAEEVDAPVIDLKESVKNYGLSEKEFFAPDFGRSYVF